MSYLKNVIINNSLGIGDELEVEIQHLMNTYHCEWAEVVNDPQLRKKFVHFVNAPEEKDPTVAFEPLRDQVRAKEW